MSARSALAGLESRLAQRAPEATQKKTSTVQRKKNKKKNTKRIITKSRKDQDDVKRVLRAAAKLLNARRPSENAARKPPTEGRTKSVDGAAEYAKFIKRRESRKSAKSEKTHIRGKPLEKHRTRRIQHFGAWDAFAKSTAE